MSKEGNHEGTKGKNGIKKKGQKEKKEERKEIRTEGGKERRKKGRREGSKEEQKKGRKEGRKEGTHKIITVTAFYWLLHSINTGKEFV